VALEELPAQPGQLKAVTAIARPMKRRCAARKIRYWGR
jgi:hypothetical protein